MTWRPQASMFVSIVTHRMGTTLMARGRVTWSCGCERPALPPGCDLDVTKTLELPRVALLSTSCDADSVAEGQLRSLHELLSKQNADGQPALNSGSSHTSLRRSKLPSSDLNEDGRLLMQRYWHIFPLLRYKDETSADQRSTERK
eukprot:3272496-Prymnesium_polylepis.1